MYRDVLNVAKYGLYATAAGSFKEGGTDTANAVLDDIGKYDKVYIQVGFATCYPTYDSRGPTVDIEMYAPVDNPIGPGVPGAPGALIFSTQLDFGATPVTATNYIIDITDSAMGRVSVSHWLTEGASGATARATYSIKVIGRGMN